VIEAKGHILVRKNPSGQLMADLWEFPYFENKKSPLALAKEVRKLLGDAPEFIRPMDPVAHSFTRFGAKLFPYYFTIQEQKIVDGYAWVPLGSLDQLSFSSGHRKILRQL
jgi:A/G-specific adenine glycosylase